jgi:hypothetical protein
MSRIGFARFASGYKGNSKSGKLFPPHAELLELRAECRFWSGNSAGAGGQHFFSMGWNKSRPRPFSTTQRRERAIGRPGKLQSE